MAARVRRFDAASYTRQAERDWSRAAPHFGKISERYYVPVTRSFCAFAGLRSGQSVLDVACGPGISTRQAAASVAPAGRVVGIDISSAMLRVADRTAGPRGRSTFKVMDAETLLFADESFDAVICHLGLMFFAHPGKALKEMSRVLRPGGPMACLVLGDRSRMAFTNILMPLLPRYFPRLKASRAPRLDGFASERKLERAFARAGMRGVSSRRLTGTYPVASAQEYWSLVRKGFGRVGPMLAALPADDRRALKRELFAELKKHEKRGRLEIPYEFVMARGRKR